MLPPGEDFVYRDLPSRRLERRFTSPRIRVETRKRAAVHDDTNPMSGTEKIAGGPQIHMDLIYLLRLEEGWLEVGVPITRPLNAIAEEHGAAVRIDIT